jgi:uncharacterized protein
VCVTVTLVDALVVARAAFRHSINYRSVVTLGKARLVTDPGEKEDALRCLTNHGQPGRWEEVRQPSEKEMLATSALVLPLEEVSAKVRSGPPLDAEEDYSLPVWAGIIPLRTTLGEPIAEAHVSPETPPIDRSRFRRFAQASR